MGSRNVDHDNSHKGKVISGLKMATKQSSALEIIEQQLTCAVCLDIYSNPKTLPCLHSFCQQCLERLPVNPQGNKRFIACPTCRTSVQLPEEPTAAEFPVAFQLNNLKEVYSLMKKATEPQQVKCDACTVANANGYCKDCCKFLCMSCFDLHKIFDAMSNHKLSNLVEVATSASQLIPAKQEKAMNCSKHNDPLRIFCETCQELICRDCTVRIHRDHEYDTITDSYHKHHQVLETSLNPVNKLIDSVAIALTDLNNRKGEIKEQGDMVKQEIQLTAKEMIEKIRQSERQLTREVETVVDSKLQVLSGQMKSAEMSLSQLKDCKEFVEQSLEMGSHQQVLMSKKQMMERMSHVTKQINAEKYNPIEKADVQLIKNNKQKLHIGNISYTTTALKVKKINRHQITCKKERVSFPLSLELPNSSLVTVPLSSLSCSLVSTDNTPINITVTTTDHPGVYRIHCSPLMNGPHQVNVQVNNVQLKCTSLVIPFNPYFAKHTSIRTIDGLNGPCGVAVSDDGHVIVTECEGNCITVLDREGKKLKTFATSGNINFIQPRGVAITPDNFILVTDDHKIQKLTMDGKLVASVGQEGSKPLEFDSPWDITTSPTTGQIYVADCDNHRIQVLNPDLTFSYSFGSIGSAEGQFSYPRFIAIENQGLVYVSDSGNNRIQVFTSEGKYVSQFGTYGSGPGQLRNPTGLVINNNLLYVAEEYNHCVSIFTTNGLFVSRFGKEGNKKDQFDRPRDIALDNKGYLYICDYKNDRLVMY